MKVKIRLVFDKFGNVIQHPVGKPVPFRKGFLEHATETNSRFPRRMVEYLRLREENSSRLSSIYLWDIHFEGISDNVIGFSGWEKGEDGSLHKQRWLCEVVGCKE